MNILQTNVSVVNNFLFKFKELFSNKQFSMFQSFIYAMLRDYKRLNLSSLSKQLSSDYQALQYFFSDSDWSYDNLNIKRIDILKRQRTTGFSKDGVLAIDDTGSLKPRAKKTEGASFQYFSTLKRQAYCNVAVASCFVKDSKHLPLNFKFYKPQDEFRLGKYDSEFKSKLDFAKELFNEAIDQNINFSYTVFDSWYGSSDFLEFINDKNSNFITEIKADRRFLFKNPLSGKYSWLQQDELVKLIKKFFPHKVKVIRYKDSFLPIYSFQTRLKNCSVPIKAFVIFNKWSDDDSKNIHILITNDLKLSFKKAPFIYMQRWGIERAFQELKDTFFFDHYQVRSKEKIMRYWMLSTLVFSLIYWIKLNGCLTKILNFYPSSFNEHKQALQKLILFSSYSFLSKNPDEYSFYFADIKSQRFKNNSIFN